ncbi:MAG: hypothetical protein KJO05_04945 [Bacteroidia bacterium]|nr:hypothetical protein [Bacteroidia bacterium]NNF30783.1 hypothetical protein [Flavobacteriaceae bacterium]MBT8277172.1 hypothetical protein [Bacteroidia bacterium]NNJ80609.1 hypothetical protein [Flavobacteriaceae bacterium]NNK54749.1 hypothetical protein [Flavobacteriaceae bacterium]
MRLTSLVFFVLLPYFLGAQEPAIQTQQDSTATQTKQKKSPFKTGFYPLGFFDVDLRYFIKYNNYEGIRIGFGGITNERLFEDVKLGGYVARGFKDKDFKFSVGGSVRVNKEHNTWINTYYFDDIREIGTMKYLTDDRVYSVFEPRLLNVTQFYKYRNIMSNIQHEFSPKVWGEFRVGHSKIDQIEDYQFLDNNVLYSAFETSEVTAALRISPKTNFITIDDGRVEYFDGLPKISAQVTQSVPGFGGSDFSYTKFGLKLDYYIKRKDLSSTNILLEGNYATGDVPLTHLFHAYPNSPTKDEILQRFSVAGRRSFETMYFGEFFSDQLLTLQVKHSLRRFYFSDSFQPELVFITRHAVGDLSNPERHIGIPFKTLEEFYSESGLELNRLLFGFGLSFAYRYGFYNLPDFEDNISFKFTFYLKL